MSKSQEVNPRVNRQERVEAGTCTRCDEPSLDDSEFCGPHRAIRRAAYRLSRSKSRKRNRAAKKCADCSNPSKAYRCVACAIAAGRPPKGVNRRVNRKRGGVKLEVGRDGATRTRNVPRFGQGGPTREETDRGLLRDLNDAHAGLHHVEAHWPPPRDAIADLPRVQRDGTWDDYADPIVQAVRSAFGVVYVLPTSWARDRICCACGQGMPVDEQESA